jgi:hypothetical protein
MSNDSHHWQMNTPRNKQPNTNKKPSSGTSSRNNNRNRNRNRNRNNRPTQEHTPNKNSSPEKLIKSYYVQIEKVQVSRRKYYDDFHHQDPNRVNKLRRNFEHAIEELRIWESKLSQEQQALITSEKNERDLTYSTLKEISPIGINEVNDEEVRDPHFIRQQELAVEQYKTDQEETVGTMDDYRSYKGN